MPSFLAASAVPIVLDCMPTLFAKANKVPSERETSMAKTTSTKTRTVLPRAVPKWKPDPLLDVDSLPVDILAGIGKLLAWWGYLQFQLGVVLREGCNWSKETGRLVTTDSNLRPLTRMLRVL